MNWAQRDIRSNALNLHVFREQLSTGKRINRPSDDPASFLRILPLEKDVADIQRYIENTEIADETFTTASASLEEVSSLMAEAKRIAVQGANGTLSKSDRANLGAAVDQILRQIVGIANSKLGDRFLFSGTATSSQPFELVEEGGNTFVRYRGTDDEVSIEVAPGTETILTSSGRRHFMPRARGETLYLGKSGLSAGTGSDSGTGRGRILLEHTALSGLPAGMAVGSGATTALGDLAYEVTTGPPQTIRVGGGAPTNFDNTSSNLEVKTANGHSVFLDMSAWTPATLTGTLRSDGRMTFDEGQTWTNIDFASTNQQLTHALSGEVVNVSSVGIVGAGMTDVRFQGTFDPFNSLTALRDLLGDKDGLGATVTTQRITELISDIDAAAEIVLESLRDVGARGAQMQLTKARMNSLEVTLLESLSREQDVDLAETILRMTQADTSYQASLQVGSRVIQRTLLDYIR